MVSSTHTILPTTMKDTTLETKTASLPSFKLQKDLPALFVSFAKEGTVTTDRIILQDSLIVGRSSECDFTIRDHNSSKKHLQILSLDGEYWVQDLGSRNGTFLNGVRIAGKQRLPDQALIRMGQTLLVFQRNAADLMTPFGGEHFDLGGKFYTDFLLQQLREAALSARHVLIAGPSGTGKELAARALATMMGDGSTAPRLVVHNAAQFASEEEAATTLFGVGAKVFSGVGARAGLIEESEHGVLFLDEIHNLAERVQRGLLRVIEDGQTKRIGESKVRDANARFVFASNVSDETKGLAHDLFARLRLVEIPSLHARLADIPSIFDAVLEKVLSKAKIDPLPILRHIGADHYEALCLEGFEEENIRGLVNIADRLVSRLKTGFAPEQAILSLFSQQFAKSLVATRVVSSKSTIATSNESVYETNKQLIISLYQRHNGNVSAIERALRNQNIVCTRRTLVKVLTQWRLRN